MMDAATNENVFEHNEESFLFQNFQTIIIFIITRFGKSKQSVSKYSSNSLLYINLCHVKVSIFPPIDFNY